MKLCIDCLAELFDSDNICYKCKSDNLLNNSEIDEIKKDLLNANKLKRKSLINQKKYNCIYNYLELKEGERYWRDVDSKSKSYNVIYPKTTKTSTKSQIKCPTCLSTNVQKISTGERVVSVAVLGLFSNKINKSFKCKDCGYTW